MEHPIKMDDYTRELLHWSINIWLVVQFHHLEKSWTSSMGRMTSHLWKIKHVWNHQPAIGFNGTLSLVTLLIQEYSSSIFIPSTWIHSIGTYHGNDSEWNWENGWSWGFSTIIDFCWLHFTLPLYSLGKNIRLFTIFGWSNPHHSSSHLDIFRDLYAHDHVVKPIINQPQLEMGILLAYEMWYIPHEVYEMWPLVIMRFMKLGTLW